MASTICLITRLRSPHRMPRATAKTILVLAFICAVALPSLYLASLARYGDTGKLFGEGRPGTLLNVGLLVASGVLCLKLHLRLTPLVYARAWLAMGVLFLLAAGDDGFRIHENLDRLINRSLGLNPYGLADHLDDLIVALYGVAAVMLITTRFRIHILHLRWTSILFTIASIMFTIMVALDVFSKYTTAEETAKLIACALIFCAVAAAEHSRLEHRLIDRAVRMRQAPTTECVRGG